MHTCVTNSGNAEMSYYKILIILLKHVKPDIILYYFTYNCLVPGIRHVRARVLHMYLHFYLTRAIITLFMTRNVIT